MYAYTRIHTDTHIDFSFIRYSFSLLLTCTTGRLHQILIHTQTHINRAENPTHTNKARHPGPPPPACLGQQPCQFCVPSCVNSSLRVTSTRLKKTTWTHLLFHLTDEKSSLLCVCAVPCVYAHMRTTCSMSSTLPLLLCSFYKHPFDTHTKPSEYDNGTVNRKIKTVEQHMSPLSKYQGLDNVTLENLKQ